jgi:prevent-host-death family protein
MDNGVMLTIEYAVTMTEPHDTEVGIADLKAKLSDFVNRVLYRSEVLYVTKNGRRVAAVVPVEVAERYEAARESAAD